VLPASTSDRIYHDLLARIASGEYPVGSKLPSYSQIQWAYGTSSLSACQTAVYRLRDDDRLVESRQGVGNFVVATPQPAPVPAVTSDPPGALRQLLADIAAAAAAAQEQLAALTAHETVGVMQSRCRGFEDRRG
jgi:DNA-binding FadR family transcriptional regulator